jgi:hypothetical protein
MQVTFFFSRESSLFIGETLNNLSTQQHACSTSLLARSDNESIIPAINCQLLPPMIVKSKQQLSAH